MVLTHDTVTCRSAPIPFSVDRARMALHLSRAALLVALYDLVDSNIVCADQLRPAQVEMTAHDRAALHRLVTAIRAIEAVIGRDLLDHPAWLADWIDEGAPT